MADDGAPAVAPPQKQPLTTEQPAAATARAEGLAPLSQMESGAQPVVERATAGAPSSPGSDPYAQSPAAAFEADDHHAAGDPMMGSTPSTRLTATRSIGRTLGSSLYSKSRQQMVLRSQRQRLKCAMLRGVIGRIPASADARASLNIVLSVSPLGYAWDVLQTVTSVGACIAYVAQTYGYDSSFTWDMFVLVVFTADYFIRWFAATTRALYPFSFNALVDFATVFPGYYTLFGPSDGAVTPSQLAFLRFVRILRILRILRSFKLVNARLTALQRQMLTLLLTILSIIFLSAGIVHAVENAYHTCEDDDVYCQEQFLTFGDALYFVIVTLATVGYGDISPKSPQGKAVVSIMIGVALVIIPTQVNGLVTLIGMQSRFRVTVVPEVLTPHVIVVGHVNVGSILSELVAEFFHVDRGDHSDERKRNMKIIIVGMEEPSEDVRLLLNSPEYETRLQYVKGSVMRRRDLLRAAVEYAEAAFVLSNTEAENHEAEDKRTILRALTLSSFAPHVPLYVHLFQGTSRNLLFSARSASISCVNEIKMQLMARNCLCPGFSTMWLNLLKTVDDFEPEVPELKPYSDGCDLEMYLVQLSPCFLGLSFRDTALMIHKAFDGLICAWGVFRPPATIVVNPAALVLQSTDQLFVSAKNRDAANSVSMDSMYAEDPSFVDAPELPAALPKGRERRYSTLYQSLPLAGWNVVEEVPEHVRGHTIITGALTDIEEFFKVYSNPVISDGGPPALIIMFVNDLPLNLKVPANVYAVRGAGSDVDALARAGIRRACSIIVVADLQDTDVLDGEPADTQAVFAHLVIDNMIRREELDVRPFVAVSSLSNLQLVSARPQMLEPLMERRSSVAAAFLMPVVDHVRRRQQVSLVKRAARVTQLCAMPFFAAGNGLAADSLHTLVCQQFFEPEVMALAKELLAPAMDRSQGVMRQDVVPEEFVGKKFGALLVDWMTKRSCLCVGLYRRPAGYPFVLTSPDTKTVLEETDLVYYLTAAEHVNDMQDPNVYAPVNTSVKMGSFNRFPRSASMSTRSPTPTFTVIDVDVDDSKTVDVDTTSEAAQLSAVASAAAVHLTDPEHRPADADSPHDGSTAN